MTFCLTVAVSSDPDYLRCRNGHIFPWKNPSRDFSLAKAAFNFQITTIPKDKVNLVKNALLDFFEPYQGPSNFLSTKLKGLFFLKNMTDNNSSYYRALVYINFAFDVSHYAIVAFLIYLMVILGSEI